MNKKGIFSRILAGLLIICALFLTCSCTSDNADNNSDSAKSNTDSKKKSVYDGTWYVISDDFGVLTISGDVLEYYEYDFVEKRFVPAIVYFDQEYIDDKAFVFDSKTGTLMTVATYDNGAGEHITKTNTFTMEVDGDYSILRHKEEGFAIGLYRVDSSVQDLSILELKEGVWYTEDRGYGILIRDVPQRLNIAHFSTTEEWIENWYESGSFFDENWNYVYFQKYSDNVSAFFEIRDGIFLSDGSMIDFMEFDNPTEYLVFEYTLKDNQLTLSGLDKKNMWVVSDEKEMPFPVSELTFVYHGEYSVE